MQDKSLLTIFITNSKPDVFRCEDMGKHTTTVDTLLNLEVNLTQERSPLQFEFIQDLALHPGCLSINDLGTRLSRTRQ